MDYIHQRLGNPEAPRVDGVKLRNLAHQLILACRHKNYLQQAFGYYCVDEGQVAGTLGTSFSDHLMIAAHITVPDPVEEHLADLSDLEVLALHEILYDVVAEGVAGRYHDWSNCGWHYRSFDRKEAPAFVRDFANRYLPLFADGFEMDESGRLQMMVGEPTESLIAEGLPANTDTTVRERVDQAIASFRRGTATWHQRRIAVRELADVLEHLKSDVHDYLGSKDESDLFYVLNRFGIRHANRTQQDNYNKPIFLTLIFHVLLATIHAVLQLRENQGGSEDR